MRISGRTLLALTLGTWLTGFNLSSMADQQSPPQPGKRRFELSAMVSDRASLSRNEVDPAAVGNSGGAAKQPKGAAVAPPEIDNSYLKEFNVDWSGWIGTQADRWYYTLKTAETTFGLQFATLRPALIQFTCYADGSIGNVILKQSSGVPVYDRLQVETLLATMPTPAFPTGTQRSSITLCLGWESHPKQEGESDFQPGSFGKNFPKEKVRQWCAGR